jgi:hypothetical protein
MTFSGFARPTTTDTPDELFDLIMPRIDNLAELKCVMYVIRHTFGYNKWMDRIALLQFEHGLVTEKRGQQRQVDAGAGLSRQSVVNGLRAAVKDGYLRKQVVCPACGGEVAQVPIERMRTRSGQAETYTEISVPDTCPHCRRKLKSRELVYYGLRWKDDLTPAATPRDILAKQRGVWKAAEGTDSRRLNFRPLEKEGVQTLDALTLEGVQTLDPQQVLTLYSTPAGAGGADSAPLELFRAENQAGDPAPGDDAHRRMPGSAGNGQHADGVPIASPDWTGRYRGAAWQLALRDQATVEALDELAQEMGLRYGLNAAGLRAARLALAALPERRRRVLEDLRRMQGRSDLSESSKRGKARAILTQNIGVTLGLGLKPDGSVRTSAEKDDYGIVGRLSAEYGAEQVWITACEIAGERIEGQPIDYLRAVLRNKQLRGNGKGPQAVRFEELDYLSDQVG